jgi:hypothetical protein
MDALGKILVGKADVESSIPDLDWELLPKDNIPTENKVEVIPQLEEQWKEDKNETMRFIPNIKAYNIVNVSDNSEKIANEIINNTKKLMMKGLIGNELSEKLASLYAFEDLKNVEDNLKELANEQGLLGKVYIDLTPFDSCEDALNIIGPDKIKMVKYVIGNPLRKQCRGHSSGFCNILNKEVKDKIEYNKDLLDYYKKYLSTLGELDKDEDINTKEDLQKVFLRVKKPKKEEIKEKKDEKVDLGKVKENFKKQIEKEAKEKKKKEEKEKFLKIRPILASVQNLMLKGKTGEDLKECIKSKYSEDVLKDCVEELSKLISLQGLIGNVYVDISLYNSPEEAIDAIKNAEISPLYVVQTYKENEYDDSLEKVCRATGCSVLPQDGNVGTDVVVSYLYDLLHNKRISEDVYENLYNKAKKKGNILVIKEAFDNIKIKKEVPKGGVKGYSIEAVKSTKKEVPEEEILSCVKKAIDEGIKVDKIINKTASLVGSSKAKDIVFKVLSTKKEINASCLSNCDKENYNLNKENTVIIQSNKCASCVYNANVGCIKQKVNFNNKEANEYFAFNDKELDEVMKKIQLDDNPDNKREDMKQKYDMSDPFGSGMNKALEKLRQKNK